MIMSQEGKERIQVRLWPGGEDQNSKGQNSKIGEDQKTARVKSKIAGGKVVAPVVGILVCAH